MTKQEQFLWIVQTAILANAVSLCSDPERAETYKLEHTATGVLILADEAIGASERIPESMSAFDAASDFCTFMLQNLQDAENKAKGRSLTVPHWFARS